MNTNTQGTNALGNEKIGHLLLRLAIPGIIAQLVSLLYNIVDRIYIGRLEEGIIAMSALTVCFPIITLIIAFTNMIGMGGAPLTAIKLGQNDNKGADKIVTNCFVVLLLMGVALTALVAIFKVPLLRLFGASEENMQMAVQYLSIYVIGTLFVQISLGMNPFINTQGFTKFGMITVMIGAALNIILDPIFIFVFDMGVRGAALATIISQAVSAIWVLKFLFGKKTVIKIRKCYSKPDREVILPVLALGISAFIMGATESLLQIAFNNQLSLYGGTMAVGTMGILGSLTQMVYMPIQGIAQGAQPILSYNYGAGNYKRVREAFKLLFICALSVSIIGIGSILIGAPFFVKIFSTDEKVVEFTIWAVRVYAMGYLVFGAQLACQQSFMALGQAKRSLIMALLRKVILLIPLIYILPSLFGESQLAIEMAQPIVHLVKDGGRVFTVLVAESVSDILAVIITVTVFMKFYKTHLCKDK